jgi:hypothetical protein
MATRTLKMTPADLFEYQNTLVRTQKYLALGRMRTIAIGPCDTYTPPANDPIINGWGDQPQRNARGRMIDLSGQWLPIGQASDDKNMILCCAPLRRADGYVGLPDLADPTWKAESFTEAEAMDPDKFRDPAKDRPRMMPQRLEDRTNDRLAGTNFLVFQPVLRITYQPEELKPGDQHGFKPAEWKIEFRPEINGTMCAFLVDQKTGECHFFGGIPFFGGDTRG